MLYFFKYLIYFSIFLSLLLFYFLFTPLGTANVYSFISHTLSQETDLDIEVQAIDITDYPHVTIVMTVEHKAKLTFWGHLDDAYVDMDYLLTSHCIATKHCKIDDDIHIKGHIEGPFTKLSISGRGTALDGNVTYSAIKYVEKVEDIHLKMHDINSTKLLNLLGQKTILKGKANAVLLFSFMDEKHKKGHITYSVSDKKFYDIPLHLQTNIDIDDDIHTFNMDVTSPYLQLSVTQGDYNQRKKEAHAKYSLNVKALSKLESLLGYRYQGSFQAQGNISYNSVMQITGRSKTFGGVTHFIFENNQLKIDIKEVFLEKIMHLFPFPEMLTARATGEIYYDFRAKKLTAKTNLKDARFIHSKLVDVLRQKAQVDLMQERFTHSTLNLSYQNPTLFGDLKLQEKTSHLYLTHTTINTQKNTMNAYFDFKMQQQEFSGEVYGSLDNPKINLNMQKLIRYQMDKQVDKMIGKHNRKMMEKMPMAPVAKDMATDMGASFMKVFF